MDDAFKRMMEMDGVRPLATRGQPAPRRTSRPVAAPVANAATTTPPAPDAPLYAWVRGTAARTAMDVALARLADGNGWGNATLGDGTTRPLPARSGAAALLAAADRMDARLIVLGGPDWTFVMHPSLGIATLDDAPRGDAS